MKTAAGVLAAFTLLVAGGLAGAALVRGPAPPSPSVIELRDAGATGERGLASPPPATTAPAERPSPMPAAEPTPTNTTRRPTPVVREVERDVEHGGIEEYEDDDEGRRRGREKDD